MKEQDLAPLHVAINAALDPGAAGGVQTNLLALVDTLPRCMDGISSTLLIPSSIRGAWRARANAGIDIAEWPHQLTWYREPARQSVAQRLKGKLKPPLSWTRLKHDRELRALGIDVVHFPYQLAFATSFPFIYEPWDFQHVHLPEFFSDGERAWRHAMYGSACRNSRLVVTATATSKRDVVELFNIDPGKVAVIYRDSTMAMDVPPTTVCIQTVAALGLPPLFAFYPAQAYPHKNHLRLFEALALLRDSAGMTVHLACSGRESASHTPKLKEAAKRLGLSAQVHFLGTVSEAELAALYRSARMLIFPSLFEGLGLPLLEAMYHELPIAASNASCIPEVVADAALLFDPREPQSIAAALRRIWESTELAEQLKSNGRRRRALFSWDRAARTMVAAYCYTGGRPLSPEQDSLLRQALAA